MELRYEFWQIFAKEVSIAIIYFGVIQLVSFGIVSLGGFASDSIKSRIGFRNVIMLALLLTGIGFSVVEHLGIGIIGIPFGLISIQYSIFAGFLYLAFVLILIGLLSMLWIRDY